MNPGRIKKSLFVLQVRKQDVMQKDMEKMQDQKEMSSSWLRVANKTKKSGWHSGSASSNSSSPWSQV